MVVAWRMAWRRKDGIKQFFVVLLRKSSELLIELLMLRRVAKGVASLWFVRKTVGFVIMETSPVRQGSLLITRTIG